MKISITNNTYSLKIGAKPEDIQLLQTYNPDALTVKNADGEVVFKISYNEGHPCVADFGVTFGGKNLADGCAIVEGCLPQGVGDVDAAKEFVANLFGAVVESIKTIEAGIPAAVTAINEAKAALIADITVS